MTVESSVSGLNIEDAPALMGYLRSRGILDVGEQPAIRNLEGGVSNRVVLVRPQSSPPFVLKQALEKLRVQVDWFCTPTRIEREALALRYFSELAPPGAIPALIFQDSGNHLLAMAEVPEPHENWKRMLLEGRLTADHVEQFGVLLGSIHRRSSERKQELAELFGDRAVFEALRLEPYYGYTASQVPEAAGFLHQLIADTLACRMSVVHGDYSPKNILVHHGKLVLLDYEVAHFGDPAFDIGFSMAHFFGKANHLRSQRAEFAQAAVRYWQSYLPCVSEQPWAADLEPRAVRHTLGCCLARVAGRSPLEYLTPGERSVQRTAILAMFRQPPPSIEALMNEFVERIACPS